MERVGVGEEEVEGVEEGWRGLEFGRRRWWRRDGGGEGGLRKLTAVSPLAKPTNQSSQL